MSKDDRCGDCRFWIPTNEDRYRGECRAMPPSPAGRLLPPPVGGATIESTLEGVWPITRSPQWCGQFELSNEKWKQEYDKAGGDGGNSC
jgi:hypothetical protein